MTNSTDISNSERKNILELDCILFFSIDVKNSVRILQDNFECWELMLRNLFPIHNPLGPAKSNNEPSTNDESFINTISESFSENFKSDVRKMTGFEIEIMRFVGDELIFRTPKVSIKFDYDRELSLPFKGKIKIPIDSREKILKIIQIFCSKVHEWNITEESVDKKDSDNKEEKDQKNSGNDRMPQYLKGAIWSAYFPKNTSIERLNDNDVKHLPLVVKNGIYKYSNPNKLEKNSDAILEDYFGTSINYGFRLKNLADKGKLIIDTNILRDFLIFNHKNCSDICLCQSNRDSDKKICEFEVPASNGKKLHVKYWGNLNLKGYDRLNPVFSIKTNIEDNDSSSDESEKLKYIVDKYCILEFINDTRPPAFLAK